MVLMASPTAVPVPSSSVPAAAEAAVLVIAMVMLLLIVAMAIMTAPRFSLSSLLLFVHSQHVPQPRLQHHVCRALAAPVQPVFKILNLDDGRNLGIPDFYGDACQALADVADPIVPSHHGEGLGEAS